jgi:hypothetical protein
MTRSRRPLLWLILLALLAAFAEAGSALTIWTIGSSRSRFLIWSPDIDALPAIWRNHDGDWDEELGWPSPRQATAPPRDADGAKRNPDFPESDACASAYGDSFVWGDDVPLADGWIEQLSRLLGCRVANYGVSGYGTDQALIRFRRLTKDVAPVAMLGIFPENVMRNVNQYRGFFGFELDPRWLKGRFVLDRSGALTWIARPRIDLAGFIALHREPARLVPGDHFLPDTRDGPVTARFPSTLSLIRLAAMPRLWTRLTGRPSWSAFYAADHPSGALPLTLAIAQAFAREARARGRKPLVVMLPGESSFRAQAKFGGFEYAPLVEQLSASGVDVLDTGPALRAALGSRSPCEMYAFPRECFGHLGVAGGGMVAQVVAAELKRRGWVK